MSIKVYQGLAFAGGGLKQTFRLLAAEKQHLQGLANSALANVLATRVCQVADDFAIARAIGGPLGEETASLAGQAPYRVAVHGLYKDLDELRQSVYRDPEIDCSIAIQLYVRPSGHRVVARVVEERTKAWEYLCSQPGVVDFSYYDNTDAPEDVSRQAWLSRKRAWTAVDDQAAVFELKIEPQMPSPEEVATFLTPKAERARATARRLTLDERVYELWTPPSGGGFRGVSAACLAAKSELEDANSGAFNRCRELEKELLRIFPDEMPKQMLLPLTF
ncbi:hypothetical protein LC612_33020 [Nostoc sp. CHAB 5834]|nr:hypothetical protein [Nostoc sp. CHAB 5834]